jgi:mRNA-degrading endonuclease toxin of MazEF toxin-antitoxin module
MEKARLTDCVGMLPSEGLTQLCEALRIALDVE